MAEQPVEVGVTGVIARRANVGIVHATGTTKPADGSIGYAPYCVFVASNGIFINVGTKASANFDSVGDVDGSLLADTISERTADAGVTIEGITLEDNVISDSDEIFISIASADVMQFNDGAAIVSSGATLKLANVGTIAAAGADQAGATAIANQITFVTSSDGNKGVRLPAATAGTICIVYDTVATSGLKIYPASGDDINDGSADAAITIEGKTMAIFVALDSTTWAAMYTANS